MNEADFSSSETIKPSVIIGQDKSDYRYRVHPTLQYLPSMKCLVYLTQPHLLTFVNDSNLDAQYSLQIQLAKNELEPSLFSLNSDLLLALGVPLVYFDYHHRIPAHVEFVKIPQHPYECKVIPSQSTQFVNPHIYDCRIHNMKYFPDGSRLIITYSNDKEGSWCKIYTLPESVDDQGDDSGEWPEEHWSVPKNARVLPCEDVNVFEQGFPTVDEDDDADDAENDDDRYFRRYNERYYSSNLDGGFFCLAISPDTTRILSGSNDAEIYVIDSTTLQVLHCKREYGNCKTVTGCHFNPLFGHEEFAVCNEMGIFDIWNITASDDDGREEVKRMHRLKFPPGTSNCVYSPDGQFIALTSAKESKTYIISSTSAMVMFTLLYPVEENQEFRHETYFLSSSLFFGNSCQVATVHEDRVICFWKLPVIYSLKTLCLILLRASIKYNDIEQLCVPNSLKELLKYLYV